EHGALRLHLVIADRLLEYGAIDQWVKTDEASLKEREPPLQSRLLALAHNADSIGAPGDPFAERVEGAIDDRPLAYPLGLVQEARLHLDVQAHAVTALQPDADQPVVEGCLRGHDVETPSSGQRRRHPQGSGGERRPGTRHRVNAQGLGDLPRLRAPRPRGLHDDVEPALGKAPPQSLRLSDMPLQRVPGLRVL